MATKKLDEYIVKAFKDLEFTDEEVQKGCWLLERSINGETKPVAWIAYHKFLERVAQKAGITFDEPKIFNLQADEIALYVNGKKGEFSAWAIGEASTGNLTKTSKNYRWAMAEKRAKDRVILKLLGIAGDMYSEEEADEFKEKPEHKEKPEPKTKTDFEKQATADKSANTKALNKAVKKGATEVTKKPRTKEELLKAYNLTMQKLSGIATLKTLTNTQVDFINNLCVDLYDNKLTKEHEALTTLYNDIRNKELDDSINF